MDYYSTLGVGKDAAPEDIKKAYRKLAMSNHPDRGGDVSRFQEIQAAYDTLSDPNKKAAYDNPQPQFNMGGMPGGMHFEFGDSSGIPDDILKHFFGMHGMGQRRPTKNKDMRIRLDVPVAETFAASEKTVNINSSRGSYAVKIDIPQGVQNGLTIRYPGQGDDQHENLPRGDLYVIINLVLPEGWGLSNNDLYTEVKVSALIAITGGEISITTLDGKTLSVKIPKGIQHGDRLALRGHGAFSGTSRGDLYVITNISIPKTLTDDQIKILLDLQKNL